MTFNVVVQLAKRVTDFETVDESQQRQDDMLHRLERALSDPGRLAGLADCDRKHCGRMKCSEVCQFGTRQRRQREIPVSTACYGSTLAPFVKFALVVALRLCCVVALAPLVWVCMAFA